MKIGNKTCFWLGISALVIMIVAYFIPINVDSGSNYVVVDSILGILIFHNAFILGLYLLGTAVLIYIGLRRKNNYNSERRLKK